MAKGFLTGAACGLVVSAAGAAALSLAFPLDDGAPRIAQTPDSVSPEDEVSAPVVPSDGAGETNAETDATEQGGLPQDPGSAPEMAAAPTPRTEVDAAQSPVELPEDETAEATRPLGAEPAGATEETSPMPAPSAANRPGAEAAIALAPPVVLDIPEPPRSDSGSGTDTAPAGLPAVALDSATLDMPMRQQAGQRVSVASEAPVQPGRQAMAPPAPEFEAEPQAPRAPAQPKAPAIDEETSGLAPAELDTSPSEPEAETAAGPLALPQDAPDPGGLAAAQEMRMPDVAARVTPDPQAQRQAGGAGSADQPPLLRYASPAPDASGAQARLSLVLIDDGRGPLGPDSVAEMPFALTIALDPDMPDARERMRRYRDLGIEVAVLGVVSEPGDEAAAVAATEAVPEAVAMVQPPVSELSASSADWKALTDAMRRQGRGMVLMPAQGEPETQDGVAHVLGLLDADGLGSDAAVERLAGTLAQLSPDGPGAILLGRLRSDTLSAVSLWHAGLESDQVVLVPVSSVLGAE